MKTIRIAGKRVPLTNLGREGDLEVFGATVLVKDLGKVTVRVERTDPEKYKKLVDFAATPRTAMEIQKHFGLKTWSAAGRFIDAAAEAGFKLQRERSAAAKGRMGRRPFLFYSGPKRLPQQLVPNELVRGAHAAGAPKTETMIVDALTALNKRLDGFEERFLDLVTAPTPSAPIAPPSH